MSASDGKQGGSNRNFRFMDSKTSNDSGSVKDPLDTRTELQGEIMQRRHSNDKAPVSPHTSTGFDSSLKRKKEIPLNQVSSLNASKD